MDVRVGNEELKTRGQMNVSFSDGENEFGNFL
jgi:hypothetical protein